MSEGRKFDSGKLRYDLIPASAEKGLAEVLTYGADKYGPNNWQGIESHRYYSALRRHLSAWRMGESHDSESGLHHLKHALANVVFLLYKEDVAESKEDKYINDMYEFFKQDGLLK